MADLFTPLRLGSLELPNRIWMAPLTRCRAEEGHRPGPLMADYYGQRASAGLIVAEATMVMEGNSAFWHEPGVYSQAQIEGWRLTTEAVHRAGGRIVLQLWHGGRACHPLLNGGAQPVGPSPIAITGAEVHTPEGKKPYVVPRELRDDELPAIVEGFRQAARAATAAGFDGVEANAAIAAGALDAVAFGTSFLANPDLPERFRRGAPLNAPDPASFYSPGPTGYTDYPTLGPQP
jgi:N-ethylmaleimide reductase